MRLPILTLLLAACGPTQLSPIRVESSSATTEELASALEGVSLWDDCGVTVVSTGGRVITLQVVDDISAPAGWVDLTTDSLWLNRAYSDYPGYQVGVVAHEMGHLLARNSAHLPRLTGMMSSPHHGQVITEADLELVCP